MILITFENSIMDKQGIWFNKFILFVSSCLKLTLLKAAKKKKEDFINKKLPLLIKKKVQKYCRKFSDTWFGFKVQLKLN